MSEEKYLDALKRIVGVVKRAPHRRMYPEVMILVLEVAEILHEVVPDDIAAIPPEGYPATIGQMTREELERFTREQTLALQQGGELMRAQGRALDAIKAVCQRYKTQTLTRETLEFLSQIADTVARELESKERGEA